MAVFGSSLVLHCRETDRYFSDTEPDIGRRSQCCCSTFGCEAELRRMGERADGRTQVSTASPVEVSKLCDSLSNILIQTFICFSYLEYLRDLEKRVDEDWPSVAESLNEIRKELLSRNGAIVNLTADERTLSRADSHVATFLDAMPESAGSLANWDRRLPLVNEGLVIPTQVNYVGKAGNIYDAGYELDGSAYVISKVIGTTWLWDRVRVSGGAYGGFCDFDSHSGPYEFPPLLNFIPSFRGEVETLTLNR